MTTLSSPPPSPLFARTHSSSSAHMPLSVSNLANIFLKMRQQRVKTKAHHIESSSGDSPQTHASLQQAEDAATESNGAQFVEDRTFVCVGGVDTVKLLRAVRGLLLQEAQEVDLNILVDEQWTCTICGPRKSDGSYRVHIHYTAKGVHSTRNDPHRPVALANARSVSGLMTIISRFD